ncbi:MAG: DUF6434 domain-containing protein [Candidatus Methanoplasma sp.]|jgi:hypothetical protein|nr:DUF6434 domain-containing protein [Candidatus Methanoplasma sp.]
MEDRPVLTNGLDSRTFRSYYYLKEELVLFCRQEGLQTAGGKEELTERISRYLDTGEKLTAKKRTRACASAWEITEDSPIGNDFVCSERHRAFFEKKIGKGFSFNVVFIKWLRSNAEKSCGDALLAYDRILAEKKKGKTTIDKQFEYNTYIRDFFADNGGKSLGDAIVCWRYKKGLKGNNRYERGDLIALSQRHDLPFEQEYEKALRIATKAHEGQKSKTGEDYIMHPIAVSGFCRTERAKIAALLHDVVEDTAVTLDDLRREGFAEDILTAVDCVSKREGEELDDYLQRVASDDIATEVKFADMRHNGSRWPAGRPKEEAEKNFRKYSKRAGKLLLLVGEERAKRSMTDETYEWVAGSADPRVARG